MSKQSNRVMEDLIPGYGKIRKRGCSSSSSSSSKVHNYRFKRAILVGKTRTGGGSGSRSSTPAPSWRMMSKSKLGGGVGDSPEYGGDGGGGGGRSRPVSARKLAATLWGMNEMPSPQNSEVRVKERKNRSVHTACSLPQHLSDPSHTPVSERMDRSGTGSRHWKMSSISEREKLEDHNGAVFDSNLMEVETKTRAQTPTGSVIGVKSRLKDVSNALTTSKELLKIIHRMWAHDDLPSSTMSLISALHTELERARLQVNQLINDQRGSNPPEINYLLKCFAEEKATWKSKERQAVEAAIESVVGELETERKLRRRFENLNKKLGRELAEMKGSFAKALKELESERRAREIMEQVCDELADDIGEDRAEAEELKRESAKAHEEVEREREMLQVADKLREERVQMKLAEAKHQFEEKNALVDKLRGQLQVFLGSIGGGKKKGLIPHFPNDENHNDINCEDEDSGESELHSIELNMDNSKNFKWTNAYNSKITSTEDETKAKTSRKSTSSIQRSVSDTTEWGIQETFLENLKQTPRRSHGDDMQRYKSIKSLRDRILTISKSGLTRDFLSPRAPTHSDSIPVPTGQSSGSKSRTSEAKGGTVNTRRSKK